MLYGIQYFSIFCWTVWYLRHHTIMHGVLVTFDCNLPVIRHNKTTLHAWAAFRQKKCSSSEMQIVACRHCQPQEIHSILSSMRKWTELPTACGAEARYWPCTPGCAGPCRHCRGRSADVVTHEWICFQWNVLNHLKTSDRLGGSARWHRFRFAQGSWEPSRPFGGAGFHRPGKNPSRAYIDTTVIHSQ